MKPGKFEVVRKIAATAMLEHFRITPENPKSAMVAPTGTILGKLTARAKYRKTKESECNVDFIMMEMVDGTYRTLLPKYDITEPNTRNEAREVYSPRYVMPKNVRHCYIFTVKVDVDVFPIINLPLDSIALFQQLKNFSSVRVYKNTAV